MILLCVIVVRVAGPLSLLQDFPEVLPPGTPEWRGQPGWDHSPTGGKGSEDRGEGGVGALWWERLKQLVAVPLAAPPL